MWQGKAQGQKEEHETDREREREKEILRKKLRGEGGKEEEEEEEERGRNKKRQGNVQFIVATHLFRLQAPIPAPGNFLLQTLFLDPQNCLIWWRRCNLQGLGCWEASSRSCHRK